MKVEESKNEKELTLEEKIQEWKKEYKKIFKNTVDGKDYIWRRVTRKEYVDLMNIKEGETVEDRIYSRQLAIAKLVVLNIEEEELNNDLEELAGLAANISDRVLDKSGFQSDETEEL